MKWKKLSADETLKTLNSSINGLSSSEAQKRLSEHGKNELVEEKKAGPLRIFLEQFKEILILILIIAAIAAYYVGDTIDAVVILVVVVINAVVGFIQEYRAEKAMEKLKGLISTEAVVLRDGQEQTVPAGELTLGDIVLLEEGDNVPADLRIIESYDLLIDESAMTGESLPVEKHAQTILSDDHGTENMAFMETDVASGRGKGVVVEIGMDTEIGKIAEMIQEEEEQTPLQQKIGTLGKTLGLLAVIVCSVVFVLEYLQGVPLVDTFMTAVSLAVAAVPEGLPAILTLTLALGMQRMAKSNAIVRKLLAVETLGSCNVICTDKTGTLTLNQMTVRDARVKDQKMVYTIAALCNNATQSEGKLLGDPTDASLLVYADENGYNRKELEEKNPRLLEIPLDSTRKRMTTVNQIGHDRYVLIKGAPEVLLQKCSQISGDDEVCSLKVEDTENTMKDLQEMTGNALRVLGFAYRKLGPEEDLEDKESLEKDLIFAGLVGMMDPPREEAKQAIAQAKKAGIRVVMITGDHKDTAVAIAREIEITDDEEIVALTGSDLDQLSDQEFENMVDDVLVYARVFPEQKVRIVETLKKKGNVASMTGDGVNDAPALKKAAIGVAMGSGTDVAKESADMLLQDDNFATIVQAVREGRTIFDNIRRFVRFQLSTNIGAILTITSSSIIGLPVPFNPIQVLWINIIMDGPPAQSLGVEPPEKGVMERPPLKEEIIPRKNLIKIVSAGVVMTVGTLALYMYMLSTGTELNRAMTMAFTVFVMYQIFNVFNCRSDGGFSNKVLLIAVGSSLLLQIAVIYLPFLQGIFRTTALGIFDWVVILLIAATIFVSDWVVNKALK
ncbi:MULTISPECIES: calcium-transporting P-type ATPase, PMR1-type [Methanobacterium]|jgi:Ca2+-transporting ATPase|uniref:P-type Ca(2+) transporter n=1 Tax=Methanobacterium formicicum TaxID=2162 RepID=A0A843ALL4_METFO|nr:MULTISPECIES: calcium-transporting P-type ATPase, PMR1-type [Methanobacterium]KUK75116.1 MAG: Cation transport ATPase [Methanobacterium sp. 42_16]MBF4474020.1 calcium-transporting P-type ATPase, PMR1-type [Methanobacterium formicicum]